MKTNKDRILKKVGQTLAVAALLGAAQQQALAEDNGGFFFGNDAPGKWTIGAKVANIDPNVEDVKDATGVGVVLGYQFAKSIGGTGGSASVELEYISGDSTRDLVGFQTSALDDFAREPSARAPGRINANGYDADVANLFFTYRSSGTLFYKVKGGLSYANVDIRLLDNTTLNREDVSLAGGVGLGYRVGDLGVIELEYSADTGESDVGLLGLNALLQF